MKNELIDTLDRLLHPQDPAGRWQAAQDVAQRMGVKSILVAQADGTLKDISWISTDMPDSWMEEYLCEGYVEVDPLVSELAARPGSMVLECGSLQQSGDVPGKAVAYNHGLRGAGFATLHCTRFGPPRGAGKYVTLGYAEDLRTARSNSALEMQLFSALLASTIEQDAPPPRERYSPPGPPLLTTRQREVLSLLAEGMMTARIAEKLGLSEAAVSLHFANARRALGAATREHALALALKQGLISL
ncbi:helix-turn-helix transcriptional regulator [Leisingera sp. ANG-M7]|uniref:helix-turn-helix transcriptional regulator n=1 Tax=Leisingera sp. ANG-M7 TaxID=1577902 RepID=UPI00068E5B1E|nr:LuxR family transcriptional regulator [Leisingera sp. ANG-M7]